MKAQSRTSIQMRQIISKTIRSKWRSKLLQEVSNARSRRQILLRSIATCKEWCLATRAQAITTQACSSRIRWTRGIIGIGRKAKEIRWLMSTSHSTSSQTSSESLRWLENQRIGPETHQKSLKSPQQEVGTLQTYTRNPMKLYRFHLSHSHSTIWIYMEIKPANKVPLEPSMNIFQNLTILPNMKAKRSHELQWI